MRALRRRLSQLQTPDPDVCRLFHELQPLSLAARNRRLADLEKPQRDRLRELLYWHDKNEADGFLPTPRDDSGGLGWGRARAHPIPEKIGRYRVDGKCGSGGMGIVYAGYDEKLGRPVAIKMLASERLSDDPEQRKQEMEARRKRLDLESRLLGAVRHPNVVTVYPPAEIDDNGDWFITMEYVEGERLDERLARSPLPITDALRILRDIASGLAAAHWQRVVHRDLKPANVILAKDGRPKILDFGIGHWVGFADGSHRWTGTVNGTPGYASPEQLRGYRVNERADIWSFGCLAFECLTGQRAISGEDVDEVMRSAYGASTDWSLLPRDLAWRVRQMIYGCLQALPRQRRYTASMIARLLDEVLSDLVKGSRRRRHRVRRWRPGERIVARTSHRRRKIRRRFVATVAVAALALGWMSEAFGPGERNTDRNPAVEASVLLSGNTGSAMMSGIARTLRSIERPGLSGRRRPRTLGALAPTWAAVDRPPERRLPVNVGL